MTDPFTRRFVLAGAVALVAAPAFAFSEGQARTLIDTVVAEINKIINSGKSESAMLRDFEGIFARYADVAAIAPSVLGPPARSASQAQLNAFAKAFQTYISRKYGRRFREFIGGEIIVKGARPVKSFYEVQSTVNLRGEAPFGVNFVVADRSGKFIDIVIEGISLLKAERSEIGAMLDQRRGDLNKLIADLPKM